MWWMFSCPRSAPPHLPMPRGVCFGPLGGLASLSLRKQELSHCSLSAFPTCYYCHCIPVVWIRCRSFLPSSLFLIPILPVCHFDFRSPLCLSRDSSHRRHIFCLIIQKSPTVDCWQTPIHSLQHTSELNPRGPHPSAACFQSLI